MTDKHKAQFELINDSLWLLLKKYVKDDKTYKQIMSEIFYLYRTWDEKDNKFSDEWWQQAIDETFMKYPEKYKGTELKDFAADLGIGFCNYWEAEKKGIKDNLTFYRHVSRAFITEWERLRKNE